jgi:CelD/BcsL family acetyltransferase involved in cellulose biosynthesis
VTLTVETDPDCPPTAAGDRPASGARALTARCETVDSIGREAWDALAARTPWATPFSRWAFHRAWWDAYGETAHDETLAVVSDEDPGGEPVAIVPLMHRHFAPPDDVATATRLRHGNEPPLTQLAPTAKVTYFGASYHADYATILGRPADLSAVADAVARTLADPSPGGDHPEPWDAVDLRRLRCADPAGDALAGAFQRRADEVGWTVTSEREDACPVVTLGEGVDLDDHLATLDKKDRHEIRRKVRRAEAAGEVRLVDSAEPLTDLPLFIDLHRRRWGDQGLFPNTPGGARSRVLFRRLFEEFAGDDVLRLSFLWVGDRRVGALVWFCEADTAYYYNGGIDPDARDLSPGVVMVERSVRRAIAEGTRRLDFLRGDEPYKYEWGAIDEPIVRLLVNRSGG